MAEKKPFVLTWRNMTLLVPVALLILLPLWTLKLAFFTEGVHWVLVLLWTVVVYFKSANILWGLGRWLPPLRSYLRWALVRS